LQQRAKGWYVRRHRLPRLLLLGTYVPAGVHKQGSAIRVGIGGLTLAARSGL